MMFKNKNIVCLFLIALMSSSCTHFFYKKAEYAYANKQYLKAKKNYEKLIGYKSQYNFYESLAKSCYELNKFEEAEKFYAKALVQNPNKASLYYNLSLAMKLNGKCEEGASYFKQFAQLEYGLRNYDMEVERFCNEKSTLSDLYLSEKIDLPSEKTYVNPIELEGELYFLSKSKSKADYDIYKANKQNLKAVERVEGNVNSSLSEGPFDIDPITNELYFTRQKQSLDGAKVNKEFVVQLEILIAVYKEGKWHINRAFAFNNQDASVGHPTFSPDGKIMVFVSDTKDGKGETDLYYCVRSSDGTWNKPMLVPGELNSPYKELTPRLCWDSNKKDYLLTFASNRPGGFGGMDLYSASFNGNAWGKLVHHEFPINSSFNEFSLNYFAEKNDLRITSDRNGNHQFDEVYQFDIYNRIKGVLKDTDGNIFSNEEIKIYNTSTGAEQVVVTDKNGAFLADIKGGVDYKIVSVSNKLEPTLVTLSSENKLIPSYYQIELITSKKDLIDFQVIRDEIVLSKVYFEFDKSNLDTKNSHDLIKLLNTLKKYEQLSITIVGHTDSRGNEIYNQRLSEERAKSVMHWLIDNGVSPHRLSFKGNGEQELINHCKDGVPCSMQEHQANRRTTFKPELNMVWE